MREMVGETQEDQVLMARAAWLYYIGGLNQEATAKRLGLTRARVNKLLADARDSGLVSITINPANVGLLPVEEAIRLRHNLDFCICTPALGHDADPGAAEALLAPFAFRAVGAAAAAHLRRHLAETPQAIVGTGWGRTMEQMTLQLAGVSAPQARFISLMGSLTSNLAYNPFEVVHAFARTTGAEGFFLPVPFIADTPEVRDILLSQQSVQQALALARATTVAYVSIGELREGSLLRSQGMISARELEELRKLGAVGVGDARPDEHLLQRGPALGERHRDAPLVHDHHRRAPPGELEHPGLGGAGEEAEQVAQGELVEASRQRRSHAHGPTLVRRARSPPDEGASPRVVSPAARSARGAPAARGPIGSFCAGRRRQGPSIHPRHPLTRDNRPAVPAVRGDQHCDNRGSVASTSAAAGRKEHGCGVRRHAWGFAPQGDGTT